MLTDTLVARMLDLGPVPILIDCPQPFRDCMQALVDAGEVVVVADRAGREFWIRSDSPDVGRIRESFPGRSWNVADDPATADAECDRAERAYWKGLGD